MGRRLPVTARIALLSIALALVSNVVLGGFVWKLVHDDAIDELRRDTIEQSDALVAVYRTGGLSALGRAIAESRAPGDLSQITLVLGPDGRRIAGVGPALNGIVVPAPTAFRIGPLNNDPSWSGRRAGYAVRQIGVDRLVSGRLLDDWEEEQRGIEHALVAAMLLSLGLGVGGGLVVSRYVAQRLNKVAAVIEGVAAGDLSRRVVNAAPSAGWGGDAFDRLATRLNAMLDKTERLMTELRIVTDGLAHDLRSPLARLRAKAEAAVLQADPAQREAAMAGLLTEADLVMRILSTMIEITRAESVPRDRLSTADPAALMEEIAELYAPVVEDAGMRFATAITPYPPRLTLHRELLTQALANLIDNALRHAGAHGAGEGEGAITLRLAFADGRARFQVEDRGPGIAEHDRAQALRRFGRLDSARSLPGAGLGMALVEAVARLHGGRLELSDNRPGLVAAIVLPVTL